MKRLHAPRGFGLLVACAFLPGCASDTLVEVEGVVTLNGKKLDNVQVEFLPDEGQKTKATRSFGVTNSEGRFHLAADDQRKGAAPGKHRVLVTDLNQWEGIKPGREDSNKPLKPSRIPARYSIAKDTPFRDIVVQAGGAPIELKITSP